MAELRQQQLEGPALTIRDFQEVTRLGVPFKIVDGDVSPFRLAVAKRSAAIKAAAGLPADSPLPDADRARVRTEVAREFSVRAWPGPGWCAGAGGTDRERLAAAGADGCGLRLNVLSGEVGVDLVGSR